LFRNYGKINASHPIRQELGQSLPKINILGRSYDNFCDLRKFSLKQSRKNLQRKKNINVSSKKCNPQDMVYLFVCLFVCCYFVCMYVCMYVFFIITFFIIKRWVLINMIYQYEIYLRMILALKQ
jgi:hypothetical protein